MAYSELIKNFAGIRDYMREFFAFGFRSRGEYSSKSARSYDNERRRVESWLGDSMAFRQTEAGKNVFISVDIRDMDRNPLFAAFKAKSFTDKDITLYFYVMDLLCPAAAEALPGVELTSAAPALTAAELPPASPALTAAEIHDAISARYLDPLSCDLDFDISTLRKKLKEFEELGLLASEKKGNKLYYRRCDTPELDALLAGPLADAVEFFAEEAPLGVVGSYISDRMSLQPEPAKTSLCLSHKHHYILDVLDSEIMLDLLLAIRDRRSIAVDAVSRKGNPFSRDFVPVRILISTRQGRYYLIAYSPRRDRFEIVRTDSIQKVKAGAPCPEYDGILEKYRDFRKHLWGVSMNHYPSVSHVEMDIAADAGEDYIVRRLERECRCGSVKKADDCCSPEEGSAVSGGAAQKPGPQIWRFSADVYDPMEMLPWIRTFTGRIARLKSTDGELEAQFYKDFEELRRMYEAEENSTAGPEQTETGGDPGAEHMAEGGAADAFS